MTKKLGDVFSINPKRCPEEIRNEPFVFMPLYKLDGTHELEDFGSTSELHHAKYRFVRAGDFIIDKRSRISLLSSNFGEDDNLDKRFILVEKDGFYENKPNITSISVIDPENTCI